MVQGVAARISVALCAGLLLTFAAPIAAVARDRMGYQAIAAGDFVTAERSIVAERRIFPHRPELTLNLAAVYARTGRVDAARALYREVLAGTPVDLMLADGAGYSSHQLARAGLARLAPETIAVR